MGKKRLPEAPKPRSAKPQVAKKRVSSAELIEKIARKNGALLLRLAKR